MNRVELKNLLESVVPIAVKGDLGVCVRQLLTDNRRVVPGSVFFAVKGGRIDGNSFIDQAIERGALAVISENPVPKFFRDGVTYIQVSDVREALASCARSFYGAPDQKFNLVGITGTNGKTTTAFCLQSILAKLGCKAGLLGTVHYDVGGRTLPAYRTTPESVDVYHLFSQMLENQCRYGIMEVSSHGIDQRRVDFVEFEVGVFLNLTQDHLDYHGSLEEYFESKAKLFTGETGWQVPKAVINLDDPFGKRLLARVEDSVKVLTIGIEVRADLCARNLALGPEGTTFEVSYQDELHRVVSPLLGRYNVLNLLAAMGVLLQLGLSIEEVVSVIPDIAGVPGRMERIDLPTEFSVLVDYAHTDDALANALSMLKEITKGRVLVVFGCGGNRDRSKRSKMVQAAQSFADYVIATADNSRSEPLAQIFGDMKKGVEDEDRIVFIEDRRLAIQRALEIAKPGDCVLLAGKGHETYQEVSDTVMPFDEKKIVFDLLQSQELIEIKG